MTSRRSEPTIECVVAAIESLEIGVGVCDSEISQVLYANRTFFQLTGAPTTNLSKLPSLVEDSVREYVASRRSLGHMPSTMRVERSESSPLYLRVLPSPAPWQYEVVILREERLREPALFRDLQARYGITRRDFQIIAGFRQGKSNRVLAHDLGVSEHRIEKLVSRMLQRFALASRHELARLVDRIATRHT